MNPKLNFTIAYHYALVVFLVGVFSFSAVGQNSLYKLPFPPGSSYVCTQGNNNPGGSHIGKDSFAFDFGMPIGSPVCAMRSGVVKIAVKHYPNNYCHYTTSCGGHCKTDLCVPCGDSVNRVVIQHADGYETQYLHLNTNSVYVNVGDTVQQGQVIALSGNSGCVDGNNGHLHVMLMTNTCCPACYYCQSVPLSFCDFSSNGGVPVFNDVCTAGACITNANSSQYFRYWFDDNFNYATLVGLSFSNLHDIVEEIDVSQLSNGLHVFNFQYGDSLQGWSSITSSIFIKKPLSILGQCSFRYWIDDNFYQALAYPITQTTELNVLEFIDVDSLSEGLHTINFQFNLKGDTWSAVSSNLFIKRPLPLIQACVYQYWFDENFTDNISSIYSDSIPFVLISEWTVDSLSNGLHTLHTRFQSNNGTWSSISSSIFIKKEFPITGISQVEYWFDENYFAHINIPVVNGSSSDWLAELDLTGLNEGLHVLNIRYKLVNGFWSSTYSNLFIKKEEQISGITEIQYWFDEDFMQAINVTSSGNLDINWNEELDISSINPGIHILHSRFKLDNTKWSSIVSDTFMKINHTPISLKILWEGYYAGNGYMVPVLYNQGMSNDQTITDSVKVELRGVMPPYPVVVSKDLLIQTDGTANAIFPVTNLSDYVVIKHRNGLETWSSNPILFSGTVPVSYDFTNAVNKAYGNNMTEVEPNIWAFYSGDINADQNIDLLDLVILESDIAGFEYGYRSTDLNGDGNVDLLDNPVLENNNANFIYSIHP